MAAGRVLLALLLLPLLLPLPLPADPRPGPDPRPRPGRAPAAGEELLSDQRAEAGGPEAPAPPRPARGAPGRPRRAPAGPCQLWSLPLAVADLGLGHASEERVIFRYCAGQCPRGARTLHGLALARLRGQARAHGAPCCGPTRFADVAFLDEHQRWQRLPQLSAAACGCGA